MIKMTLGTDKGPIAIVGINDQNLRRMKAGMPLDINLKEFAEAHMRVNRVVVHYAHTYEDVLKDMRDGGMPVNEAMIESARKLDAETQVDQT